MRKRFLFLLILAMLFLSAPVLAQTFDALLEQQNDTLQWSEKSLHLIAQNLKITPFTSFAEALSAPPTIDEWLDDGNIHRVLQWEDISYYSGYHVYTYENDTLIMERDIFGYTRMYNYDEDGDSLGYKEVRIGWSGAVPSYKTIRFYDAAGRLTTRQWTDKDFFTGVNLPWIDYGWDIGRRPDGQHGGYSTPDKAAQLDTLLRPLAGSVCRIFLFGDLRSGIQLSEGNITGFDAESVADLKELLNAAEANGVKLILNLFDYQMADGYTSTDGWNKDYPQFITDSTKRAQLINAVKDLFDAAGLNLYHSVSGFDIINEPEYATAVSRPEMTVFVNEFKDMLSTYFSGKFITVGAGDRQTMLDNWSTGFGGYQFHYYDWMTDPGRSFETPAFDMGLDNPVFAGELQPTNILSKIQTLYDNGYAGGLFWRDATYHITPEELSTITDWFHGYTSNVTWDYGQTGIVQEDIFYDMDGDGVDDPYGIVRYNNGTDYDFHNSDQWPVVLGLNYYLSGNIQLRYEPGVLGEDRFETYQDEAYYSYYGRGMGRLSGVYYRNGDWNDIRYFDPNNAGDDYDPERVQYFDSHDIDTGTAYFFELYNESWGGESKGDGLMAGATFNGGRVYSFTSTINGSLDRECLYHSYMMDTTKTLIADQYLSEDIGYGRLFYFYDDILENKIAARVELGGGILGEVLLFEDVEGARLTKSQYSSDGASYDKNWYLWGDNVYEGQDNVRIECTANGDWNYYWGFAGNIDNPAEVMDVSNWTFSDTIGDISNLPELPELGNWWQYCAEHNILPEFPPLETSFETDEQGRIIQRVDINDYLDTTYDCEWDADGIADRVRLSMSYDYTGDGYDDLVYSLYWNQNGTDYDLSLMNDWTLLSETNGYTGNTTYYDMNDDGLVDDDDLRLISTYDGITLSRFDGADYDQDGVIDWDNDVEAFISSYQARIGDKNYYAGFDFNKDGRITSCDIAPLSWMYGLARSTILRMDMDDNGSITQEDYNALYDHMNPSANNLASQGDNEVLQRIDVENTLTAQFSGHFAAKLAGRKDSVLPVDNPQSPL